MEDWKAKLMERKLRDYDERYSQPTFDRKTTLNVDYADRVRWNHRSQ
jgi:hypothetical protein